MITARDVMHAKAQCINEDQTLQEAAEMMAKLGVGALPICGSDQKLKGIITDRDIVIRCIAKRKDPASMKAMELAGHPHCVRSEDSMDTVLKKMKQHQIRRILVIDGEKLVGMISEADLANGHMMGKGVTDQMIADFMDGVYAKR
ncbi:CBS domain-containing protein [Kitasatospora sp. GP82]|uniref:CBS domain-containing protein n=1 Tax=Kitasatospora sp. GP82 TaxID=3035089 RepID=UPI0024762370|nr:CBS domain-containing protein [Kitasatospora sp. GP82]MDH6123939.1 CBS domain-containing protein [Kitasatospora sp. GP82]